MRRPLRYRLWRFGGITVGFNRYGSVWVECGRLTLNLVNRDPLTFEQLDRESDFLDYTERAFS